MSWRDAILPVRMERIAVVAPAGRLREVLLAVAAAGVVEPTRLSNQTTGAAASALARLKSRSAQADTPATVFPMTTPPDLGALERSGSVSALVAEADLEAVTASAGTRGRAAAIAGWTPASEIPALTARLGELGGTVVLRPFPFWAQPPTLLPSDRVGGAFQPLVDTYAPVPYTDVNPSMFAGLAYVAMFGMMFGDVGHGALLIFAGVLVAAGRPSALARYRAVAPFVIGAGVASATFGFAYGEAFGPTGLVPTLWLAPLGAPLTLMAAGIGVGAALLSVSYVFGTVNRWREGGFSRALVALPGLAGFLLYGGLALFGLGSYLHVPALNVEGACIALAALVLASIGLFAASGGRFAGAVEAGIELFDGATRLVTNTISFTRLAAFGLTHVALGGIVWSATSALWVHGPRWWALAAGVFLIGNAVTFALEALVAAIQALRLEYYEMFSRIFVSSGRLFAPWLVPILPRKEPS